MALIPILLVTGCALLLALLIGRLAFSLHLPRVTGYLFTGLLTGPSVAHFLGLPALLNSETLQHMSVISDLALALILLSIGMQFRSQELRRWRFRLGVLSFSEISATFLLVTLATGALNFFILQQVIPPATSLSQSSLYIGLLLGVIGVATAPAATLLVIREYEAEGPVTDTAVTLIGLNNLGAILGFNLLFHFIFLSDSGYLDLLWRLFFPLALGGAVGFLMSLWGERLRTISEYQILVLGGAIAVAGCCRLLGTDMLLGCFACGTVLANASPKADDFIQALRQKDYVFYVLFFVIAGAGLHLELLLHIGFLGAGYIAARTAGKLIGCRLGARIGDFSLQHRTWTGPIMLAQAGVAIGMVSTLSTHWEEGGKLLETVVLGAVVVFELSGPIAARLGLLRVGEVPILALLAKRAPAGSFEGLHHVVDHFRTSLGIPHGHRVESPGQIMVQHVMRKNVDAIRNDTPFDEFLRLIAHSRYDRFPIVDAQGQFKGIIDYADIRDVLFEPTLAKLVIADELAKPNYLFLRPDQTLDEVLHIFRRHKDISYLPVIDDEDHPQLLGILSQNDVLATFRLS